MPMLRQLAWFTLQIGIVGGFLWLGYKDQGGGDAPPPGAIFIGGLFVAVLVTGVLNVTLDKLHRLWCYATGRPQPPKRSPSTPDPDPNTMWFRQGRQGR